ncbi:hypothetical protein C9374_008455 [Naegleria lovaniensis]|uniref:Gelsolin-like domain-containing protein n=1 Tax=Naegleria lovaniensis TaxID=51637 RepID=A0AA88KFH4_NAELO|nr:uncharacterized protein C9374_008455 [Naegleria lovaniensis]KAG2378312.1 hypothetical protein C9374_008455 [Naegleria lovaniensis]
MPSVQELERQRLAAMYGGGNDDQESSSDEEESTNSPNTTLSAATNASSTSTTSSSTSTTNTTNRSTQRKQLFGGAMKNAMKKLGNISSAGSSEKKSDSSSASTNPPKFSTAIRVLRSVKEMHSRVSILVEDQSQTAKMDLDKALETPDIILNQDDLFEGAGEKAGLQIWHLVKMIPIAVPEEEFGKFNSSDCYVLCYTFEAQDDETRLRKIHYWVGKNANVMKQAVCAFLSNELANRISASLYREEEREESEDFLEYFDHHIEYRDACATQDSLLKVSHKEFVPRLMKVDADHKRRLLVKRVHLSKSQIESASSVKDVFILENEEHVYVWIGSEASKTEQLKGVDVARNIIHDDRKGKGHVEIIHQSSLLDSSSSLPSDFLSTFEQFGNSHAKSDASQDAATLFSVSVLSVEDKKFDINKIAAGELKRDMLNEESVYLLETKNEIYLWFGKKSKFVDRKCAETLAATIQNSSPDILEIHSCFSGNEPVLFRERFLHGFYLYDTPEIFEKKRRELADICDDEFDSNQNLDIRLEDFNYKEKLDYVDPDDEGTGTVQIWRVVDANYAEPVPEEELGNFYSEDCYLILYEWNRSDLFQDDDEEEEAPPAQEEEEEDLPPESYPEPKYKGYESDDSDSLEARMKLIDGMGVKVTEVTEEPEEKPKKKYEIKKPQEKEQDEEQQEPQLIVKPLNIKKKKIFYLPRRILYCWEGADSQQTVSARILKRNFQNFASDPINPAKIITQKEGKENDHFMKIFEHIMVVHKGTMTNKRAATSLYRIYCKTVRNSKAVQVEKKRNNLNSNDVFILLGPRTAYLWIGVYSSGKKKEIAFKLAQSLIGNRDVSAVDEGFEPEEFWDLFTQTDNQVTPYVTEKLNYAQGVVFECTIINDNTFRVMNVGEIGQQFLQQDLNNSHQILIVDYTEVIFVWYPSTPSSAQRALALKAVAYILKDDLAEEIEEDEKVKEEQHAESTQNNDDANDEEHDFTINNSTKQFLNKFEGETTNPEIPRFPRSISIYEVERGMEPSEFKSGFPVWREEKHYVDQHEDSLIKERESESKLIAKSLPFLQLIREKYPFLITNDEFVNVHNMVHIIKLARLCKNNYNMLIGNLEQLEEEYKDVIYFGEHFEAFASDLFKFMVTNKIQ